MRLRCGSAASGVDAEQLLHHVPAHEEIGMVEERRDRRERVVADPSLRSRVVIIWMREAPSSVALQPT